MTPFLDDVIDGEEIASRYRVRSVVGFEMRIIGRGPLNIQFLVDGFVDDGMKMQFMNEFEGKPVDAKTAREIAQWVRENL